jgi:hypothetical protein
MEEESLTLRVVGLGHKLTFELRPSATIGDTKAEIEAHTSLPREYTRLIARGKKLDDDGVTLAEAGIVDRTSLMLLKNKLYATDQEGLTKIMELTKELDDLTEKMDTTSAAAIHETVTQICCKLDGIDTHGSSTLRSMRKRAIERAEALDNSKGSAP